MTRLFTAGAEAGSLDVFASISGVTVSTVQKRTGNYSFLYADNSVANIDLPGDKTVLYCRLGLYLTGYWSNTSTFGQFPLILLKNNLGGNQVCLCFHYETRLMSVIRGNWNDTVLLTGTRAIPLNAWCCIEWYIKIADGTDGESTVKLDGATDITIPADDTKATAVAGVRTIMLGGAPIVVTTRHSLEGYVDDIAINDNAGVVNNSWIGRGGVYPKLPTGPGEYADLHASVGDPFECVNEVPPSDADYISDSVIDQKSTFAGGSVTPATGAVACVNVILRSLLEAGQGEIAALVRSNGIDAQGDPVGLDVSAKTVQTIFELDPGDEPDVAWTIDRVNAMEFGAVVR